MHKLRYIFAVQLRNTETEKIAYYQSLLWQTVWYRRKGGACKRRASWLRKYRIPKHQICVWGVPNGRSQVDWRPTTAVASGGRVVAWLAEAQKGDVRPGQLWWPTLYFQVHRCPLRGSWEKKHKKVASWRKGSLSSSTSRTEDNKKTFSADRTDFKQRIAAYEVDEEGRFSLKYLPSRFDNTGKPQINIGIYRKQAFLITNLDKVTNSYSWAEFQALFTKSCNLQQHTETCGRWETNVECRGKK